jgi:hypothetical protein
MMFAATQRSSTVLENYRDLIEEILSDLGIDPQENLEEAQEKQRYSWCVKRGSANVFIELFSEENESYFMVDCPLLRLPAPEQREGFYRRLLELNDKLVEAALVARGDEIHLVGIRPLRGLDTEEASGMLDRISSWADGLDNRLSEEFGAPLWEGPSSSNQENAS